MQVINRQVKLNIKVIDKGSKVINTQKIDIIDYFTIVRKLQLSTALIQSIIFYVLLSKIASWA